MIMKYQLKVVLLSMLLLLNYNVQAYELRDAIKDAAHHNQELHKLKEDLAIITLTKAKAATEFLPDVNAEWSKKNNGEGRSNLMIKQEIYAGGKSIARIASANARIASANQEYKEKVNNIIYDVISTYQSILTIRDKIKVMKNDVLLAKKHLDKTNINVDAGAYTKSESFLAKAYLSEQESALEESKDQLVMQEAKFKYHTGKNPPKDFRSIDLKKYEVMSWKEMMPEMDQFIEADSSGHFIITGILYFIISFGLFGTLLMMMFERKHEIGILIAIGMKKHLLGFVLLLESIMISLIGCSAGIVAGILVVKWFTKYPIQLTGELKEVYEDYGVDSIIYFSSSENVFITQALIVLIVSILLALYPGFKVMKLKPVESINS